MDLEDSETDEAHDNSSSSTENQPAVEAMAATVQESARLASTHHASTDQGADDSRGSLEGLPTPADSNAAAVANTMLGAELVRPFEGAEVCRPPNPYSKLVAATPSVSTVDADAPLLDVSKAVTELDSSSKGVQPVDSYEEAFGALVTAAAAAAVSGSHDGWTAAPQGREGADAAAAERVLRVARADEGAGDAEGTGTWTAEAAGGDAASDETPTADAVDGERTGTWTAEAADADAAAAFGPDSSQPSEHATENADSEGRASLGRKDDSSGSRSKGGNWLQRMLGGGGNEGKSFLLAGGLAVCVFAARQARCVSSSMVRGQAVAGTLVHEQAPDNMRKPALAACKPAGRRSGMFKVCVAHNTALDHAWPTKMTLGGGEGACQCAQGSWLAGAVSSSNQVLCRCPH